MSTTPNNPRRGAIGHFPPCPLSRREGKSENTTVSAHKTETQRASVQRLSEIHSPRKILRPNCAPNQIRYPAAALRDADRFHLEIPASRGRCDIVRSFIV